jgi:hypothetical protein
VFISLPALSYLQVHFCVFSPHSSLCHLQFLLLRPAFG